MRENLLKKQPTWGLRRAQGTGQKSVTPATLTKIILVLLTMILLPSAAWGQISVAGNASTGGTITGSGITGTVTFDAGTSTLTLDKATIAGSISYSGTDALTIALIGENTMNCGSSSMAFVSTNSVSLSFSTNSTDNGSLTISDEPSYNFDASNITSFSTGFTQISCKEGSGLVAVSVDKGMIYVSKSYRINIGGVTVTTDNANNVSGGNITGTGTVKYVHDEASNSGTLQLTGVTISGTGTTAISIPASLLKLTINIQGSNTIKTINNDAVIMCGRLDGSNTVEFSGTGSLTLERGVETTPYGGVTEYLTVNGSSYKDGLVPTYLAPENANNLNNATKAEISIPYGLIVAGVEVTSKNKDDIFGDGKVSFNPESVVVDQTPTTIPAKLTLKGATIEGEIKWTKDFDFSIIIDGVNSITHTNTGTAAIRCTYSGSTAKLSFEKAEGDGERTLIIQSEGGLLSGFSGEPNIGDGLKTVRDQDGNSYMGITTRDVYELSVGGTQVHDIQELPGYKDNILGDTEKATAKFELTGENSGKLTLDNAVIYGTIMSDLSNLTVHVIGNNLITYGFIQGYINSENIGNNNLILEKEDGNSLLSIEKPSTGGGIIYGFKTFKNEDFALFPFNSSSTKLSGTFTYDTDSYSLKWTEDGNQEDVRKMVACVFYEGNGNEIPYKIKTKEDLANLSTFVSQGLITNQKLEVVNPIDCSGLTNYVPIGANSSSISGFMGSFNGGGYTISNLTINSKSECAGLFAKLGEDGQSGSITNVKLSDCNITGAMYVGGIVGLINNGSVKGCEVHNSTITCDDVSQPYIGGIAGELGSSSDITECIVDKVKVKAETTYDAEPGTAYSGGIVGSNTGGAISSCKVMNGTIITCNSEGEEYDYTLYAGAIAGSNVGDLLSSNLYYYDVIVETKLDNNAAITRSDYTHRGTGSANYDAYSNNSSSSVKDPEGIAMYTKKVTIPLVNESNNPELVYYYSSTTSEGNIIYNVAPDVETDMFVLNYAIKGSYTVNGETKTIEPQPKEGETETYSFTMPDADVTFTIQKAAEVWMHEGQVYGTYYNATEDMAVPMGMTAYMVTGISEDGTKVTMTRVSYIKAGVAVLIENGNDGTEISQTTDFSGSKMAYSDPDTPAKPSATDKWYVIYNNKFVKVTTGTEVSGGKCYLNLNGTSSSGTRSYYDIDGSDGTTALREVKSEGVKGEKWGDGEWFTLQGRRLSAKPTKSGLYLHNGIKVVIK